MAHLIKEDYISEIFEFDWIMQTNIISKQNNTDQPHVCKSKIINTGYANMPKSTDINSLLQLISTCEIDTQK